MRTENNGGYVHGTVNPNAGLSWSVRLSAPAGQRLAPGLYENATRQNIATGAGSGIDVSGGGAGCNHTTGRFRVHAADFAATGNLRKLHVTFEQFCEVSTAALRGEFVMIVAPPAVPPPTPGVTSSRMTFVSDATDYIGAGQTQTWTAATATFGVVDTPWGIELTVTPSGEPNPRWHLGMAVNGLAPSTGSYEQAGRYPVIPTGPTFSIRGEGRGCNVSTSAFVIHELTRVSGQISRLHVTFEQHCENRQAALRGEWIYVNP